MKEISIVLLGLLTWFSVRSQHSENVILVTLDGTRWQEVFGGADPLLLNNSSFINDKKGIKSLFKGNDRAEARSQLIPWFWKSLVEQGQLYGNRWLGNKVNCTNRFWISYPGYNEILCGYSDPWIATNAKKYNPNVTILEWFNHQPEFCDRVAAFASWDAFPFIINDQRSGVPVNAGFRKADDDFLTANEIFLNTLLDQVPSPWESVRLDAFTHQFMLEYLAKYHPRLVFVSYGEMDDYAHSGQYDEYLKSINQTDKRIGELWDFLQADSAYSGKTTMIITTDHGRGYLKKSEWQSHGLLTKGSGDIWLGIIGPGITARGEIQQEMQIRQNQIAKTIATILGYDFSSPKEEVGESIKYIFNTDHEQF